MYNKIYIFRHHNQPVSRRVNLIVMTREITRQHRLEQFLSFPSSTWIALRFVLCLIRAHNRCQTSLHCQLITSSHLSHSPTNRYFWVLFSYLLHHHFGINMQLDKAGRRMSLEQIDFFRRLASSLMTNKFTVAF